MAIIGPCRRPISTLAPLMLASSFRTRLVVLAVGMTLLSEALCSVAWNLGFTFIAAEFPLVIGNLHTVLVMGLVGLALSVFRGDGIAREMPGRPMKPPRLRGRAAHR